MEIKGPVYLVWNPKSEEGVVFSCKSDAVYAATGAEDPVMPGVSSLGDNWREDEAPNGEQFPMLEINLGPNL